MGNTVKMEALEENATDGLAVCRKMTDEQCCLSIPELTAAELSSYRKAIKMTQREFAAEFCIPLGTLRRWEQAQNAPRLSKPLIEILTTTFNRIKKEAS